MEDLRKGASAVSYDPEREKFLLVKRATSKKENPGKWEFPGGIVEENESPEDAALRELEEETSLEGIVLRSGEPGLAHSSVGTYEITPFLVKVSGDVELSKEHTEMKWVDLEQVEDFDTVEGIDSELRALDLVDEKKRVVAAVARNSGEVLVLRRDERMRTNPGKWEFASGRIEKGENVEEAALRELKEETGLEAEVRKTGEPFEVKVDGETLEINPVLVSVDSRGVELSFEHTEFRWLESEELGDLETVQGFQNDLESLGLL